MSQEPRLSRAERRQLALTAAEARWVLAQTRALEALVGGPAPVTRGAVVAWAVELLLLVDPPEGEDPTVTAFRRRELT
jgi:hypothetical protein